jgi:uncharacterized repeat protein (TIGR01451 family)
MIKTIILMGKVVKKPKEGDIMDPLKNGKKNRKSVQTFGIKILFSFISLCLILMANMSFLYAVAPLCNPTTATLCAADDDSADIYVNGTFIGTFPYCDKGDGSCTPKCVVLTPAQLAVLMDSGNYIAVENKNTATDEVWASWSLDITCATGHVLVSSDNAAVKMLYNPACDPAPSPTPSGGRQWYDPLYVPNAAWVAPADMTGQKWGKRIMDPSTGTLLHALSFASSYAPTACGLLNFREGFDMTPAPTPVPPAFTITKSANPSTNIGQSTPYNVTFNLHICNTGGGTFGNPVTINDNWNDAVDNWQFVGGDYTDVNVGLIKGSGSGKTATIIFSEGFPDHYCYDYSYYVTMYSGSPTFCAVWHNVADLSYLANPVIESAVTLNDYCPPPPVLTLVKSANKTTNIVNGDNISFNLHVCNTGGAAWNGMMTLVDDWTSNGDNWQYDGPYYIGGPATGINHIDTSNSGKVTTYKIYLQQPGFTGCVDIPMNMHMTTKNPGSCTWVNNASLSYFASPVVNSSVAMADLCTATFTITPTFTITMTRTATNTPTATKTITPTATYTQTFQPPTSTFTRTNTSTATLTMTPTYTITPQPTMAITKTSNVSVATFGDIITYTLSYKNTGTVAANPVCIYDTAPAQITYINSSLAPTTGAPLLSWCIGSVNPGVSGSITWWGKITSYPFNPLFGIRIYLGDVIIDRKEQIATYKSYVESVNLAFAAYEPKQ